MMGVSIFSRKRDLLYLVFFMIHIPTVLFVDLGQHTPAIIHPQFVDTLRAWYIENYRDRFFTNPPTWFNAYLIMEAVYHIPLSLWAIPAILNDNPKMPLNLLVFASQVQITTLTCVVDIFGWDLPAQHKKALYQIYVPYLAFALFMAVDMVGRLGTSLDSLEYLRRRKTA